jgi:glycosyltransferase involved in cell wall biosynthesis
MIYEKDLQSKTRFPKISIITPTLNQASFIEETILSVLSQDYPNLEYFIIDGGSVDGTPDIVKKYSEKLNFISEPDDGQVDAINKGMKLISGDIIGFINSDDLYLPNSFNYVRDFFSSHPEAKIITGKCKNIDISGNETRELIKHYKNFWLKIGTTNSLKVTNFISQPSTFWRADLVKNIGYFNREYRYAFDYEYWLRASQYYKIHFVDEYLASFRVYSKSITGSNSKKQFEEEQQVASNYANSFYKALHKLHSSLSYLLYSYVFNKQKYGDN